MSVHAHCGGTGRSDWLHLWACHTPPREARCTGPALSDELIGVWCKPATWHVRYRWCKVEPTIGREARERLTAAMGAPWLGRVKGGPYLQGTDTCTWHRIDTSGEWLGYIRGRGRRVVAELYVDGGGPQSHRAGAITDWGTWAEAGTPERLIELLRAAIRNSPTVRDRPAIIVRGGWDVIDVAADLILQGGVCSLDVDRGCWFRRLFPSHGRRSPFDSLIDCREMPDDIPF